MLCTRVSCLNASAAFPASKPARPMLSTMRRPVPNLADQRQSSMRRQVRADHSPPKGSATLDKKPALKDTDPELDAFFRALPAVARPGVQDEARTLLNVARFGYLSTLSRTPGIEGFPGGSTVEFVVDAQGHPVFAVSSMSAHTGDMKADPRVSLTVTSVGFKSIQDARHTLTGRVTAVSDADRPALRDLYMAKFPEAYYIDFGDFNWFIMSEIISGRSILGFGRAGSFTGKGYEAAVPDPVTPFSVPVCKHMNEDDHQADLLAMAGHYMKLSIQGAYLSAVDSLGMDMIVTRGASTFNLRVPFPHVVTDRKGIKDAIVELTKAAKASPDVLAWLKI